MLRIPFLFLFDILQNIIYRTFQFGRDTQPQVVFISLAVEYLACVIQHRNLELGT